MTRGIVAALVASAVLLANTGPHLVIRIDKYQVMSGTELTVTCVIPRDANNRALVAAVDPVGVSLKQIDGDVPQQTYQFTFKRIPCDAYQARCRLRTLGRVTDAEVTQRFQMAGCESSADE